MTTYTLVFNFKVFESDPAVAALDKTRVQLCTLYRGPPFSSQDSFPRPLHRHRHSEKQPSLADRKQRLTYELSMTAPRVESSRAWTFKLWASYDGSVETLKLWTFYDICVAGASQFERRWSAPGRNLQAQRKTRLAEIQLKLPGMQKRQIARPERLVAPKALA